MVRKLNYDKYIGETYEDMSGNLWNVKDVYRKEFSNKVRTVCLCINELDNSEKEIRLDVLKNLKGKSRNEYIFKEDFIIGLTSKGEEFYLDIEDYDVVKDYMWHLSNGYVCTNGENGKQIAMHRLVMNVLDSSIHIDHIEHNKRDNRKNKLRISNNQNNSMNKGYARSNTGYIGVYKNKNGLYEASIKHNYKKIYLGKFKNIKDAIKARLKAEKEIFKEYSPQIHLFEEYGI